MRILLVSPFFPPQNTVASLRTHPFAMHWSRAGEQVTVLTTRKRPDQGGLDLPRDGFELVEIGFHVPRWFEKLRSEHKSSPPLNGSAKASSRDRFNPLHALRRIKERSGAFSGVRMPDLTHYWIKPALRWCRDRGTTAWDLVVSSAGPYTAHLVAMSLKRQGLARRWVADYRDLWLDNHLYRGLFPFTIREKGLERQCLAEADFIVTVSEGFAATLKRKTQTPVEVIYNGFDPAAMESINLEPRDSGAGGPPTVRIVYAGTLYPQGQDPDLVVKALAAVKQSRPDLASALRLCTAGQGSEIWRARAAALGVDAMVESRGMLERAQALRLQRDAHALVILDWKDPSKGWLAAKVFECLACQAPILVIGGSERSALASLVHRAGRGVHLGTDRGRIERALIDLADDPARFMQSLPRRDEAFIATLSRQHQSIRLLERMRELGAQDSSSSPQ